MATMRSIGANRAMETTETTGTGAYALEGPVAGYTDFRSTIATGQKVAYCVQQASYEGNGDLIGMDFEIGIGTLTHGSPDTLARTLVLQSTNGDAAVNWGPGTKTIFATLPAELVPVMAAALTSGQAGKALVVDAASRAFELGGPFVPAAGGEINGLLEIIRAGLPLGLRDTDNTDAVRSLLALARGTGGGDGVSVQAQGDEANGIDLLRFAFEGGGAIDLLRDGRLTLGADGSGNLDAVNKGQLDAVQSAIPAAASIADVRAETAGDTFVRPDRVRLSPAAAGAWVSFDGRGAITVHGSYNTSGITDNSAGSYTQNFTSLFADDGIAPAIAGRWSGGTGLDVLTIGSISASSVNLINSAVAGGNRDAPTIAAVVGGNK